MYAVIKNLWGSLHLHQSDYHLHTDSGSGVTMQIVVRVFFFCFRCMVKVTGDITVSFPASVLPLLYDTENAPLLSFLVRGTSCLEQILPNKALINRY